MPQIAQLAETYASQIFWLLVTFGLVFFVIGLGMVPKVQATVAARDGQIAADLAAAQTARAEADKAEEDWRVRQDAARADAFRLTNEAKARGQAEAEARLNEANAANETRVEEAEARIEAASQAAMSEIESVAGEAARDLVARLSGLTVSEAEARAAAGKALANG